MTHHPLYLSVVVLTRDRAEILYDCLSMIYSQEYEPFEVIVVDNSVREHGTRVVETFSKVHYIRENPATDNVSYLRNRGIDAASGDIITFIDDDTIVQPGWLAAIDEAFRDPTVGGVTGRVVDKKFPEVQTPEILRLFPDATFVTNVNNTWPQPVDVDFLYGANMSFRRTALAQVGGFDPWMGYSRQDQEMSVRVKRAGYRLIYWPGAVVQHLSAPRAAGTVQRNAAADFRTRRIKTRSVAYQSCVHYGMNWNLFKNTLWGYPKEDLLRFLRRPTLRHLLLPFATATGLGSGFLLAGLARAGFHSPPTVVGRPV